MESSAAFTPQDFTQMKAPPTEQPKDCEASSYPQEPFGFVVGEKRPDNNASTDD
jgi:hypothetical protein